MFKAPNNSYNCSFMFVTKRRQDSLLLMKICLQWLKFFLFAIIYWLDRELNRGDNLFRNIDQNCLLCKRFCNTAHSHLIAYTSVPSRSSVVFAIALRNGVPSNLVLGLVNPWVSTTKRCNYPMGNIPYQGHKQIPKDRDAVEQYRSISKTEENRDRVRALVRSESWLTLKMISSELNLNHLALYQILTQDFRMRKVCARIVPPKNSQLSKKTIWRMCLFLLNRKVKWPRYLQ